MLRKQSRLRREYLYRKAQEDKERSTHDRKEKLKKAIREGKTIPTELRKDHAQLQKELQFEDEKSAVLTTHVDDEYAKAGINDPRIVVTTSRDPSSRLKQFAKEVRLLFPNAQRMNRGNHVMQDLMDACRANEITDLIIVHEHRGEPDGLVVSHLPYGPTAYFSLSNVVMRHDITDVQQSTVSEAYPHLIFNNFNSKLGQRVMNILKYLYPVPKEDTRRVITFANESDYISFRHHTFKKTGHKQVELEEVGPRFEMKLYKITLGTVEQADPDIEWVAKSFMNTAHKRDFL
eukprot:Colp12_sorted_trinity150504_noHs@9678